MRNFLVIILQIKIYIYIFAIKRKRICDVTVYGNVCTLEIRRRVIFLAPVIANELKSLSVSSTFRLKKRRKREREREKKNLSQVKRLARGFARSARDVREWHLLYWTNAASSLIKRFSRKHETC